MTGVPLSKVQFSNPLEGTARVQIDSAGLELSRQPFSASDTFIRPSDTTAYTALDLIANSTTAASVVPLAFTVSRIADRPFEVRRALIKADGTVITNATFRLHLFSQSPVVATSGGDNAAFATYVPGAGWLGSMGTATSLGFSDAIQGETGPLAGLEVNGYPATGTRLIYGLLQAVGAYTPTSAEVFTVTLQGFQY